MFIIIILLYTGLPETWKPEKTFKNLEFDNLG